MTSATTASPPPPPPSDRVELARLCRARDWSKAIRVLDSLLHKSNTTLDICNRAFCYSQLELHKHVVKDCDRAIAIDPSLLQPYIMKGRALSAMGRKMDALLVWEKGYAHALNESADLKQLLELEELLSSLKQDINVSSENQMMASASSMYPQPMKPVDGAKFSEVYLNHKSLKDALSNSSHSNGASDGFQNTNLDFKMTNGFNHVAKENGKDEVPTEEGARVIENLNDESESCESETVPCSESSVPSFGSCDVAQLHDKLITQPVSKDEGSDETIPSKLSSGSEKKVKSPVPKVPQTRSISVDFRLSRGIAQVNEGKYANAISIFNRILNEDPTYPEALIGRGTAYAFQRELDAAISDFSKAIECNPSAGEAWKRRGQAWAALGESTKALIDLTKALEFEPDPIDILHERGIVNFKFKDFGAAIEDLSTCLSVDKDNKSAYTYLGLALAAIGEYKKAEEAHLEAIKLDQCFLEAWTHLIQLNHELARPTKALECLINVVQIDKTFVKGYHLHGLLLHGMGNHRKAIEKLSIGLQLEKSNIECLYLRGSCYHAIGEFGDAVKDYDAALDVELDSMENFVLQCLAFYQKELALYTASKFSSEFGWFDIDGDIHPLFKEYWCKRLHPKDVCEKVYRQPRLRDSLRKGKLKKLDFTITKQKTALILLADSLGKGIQYDCPGFLPNRRQHRMAGFAAIEIAQRVSKCWRTLRGEWRNSNKSPSKIGKRARRRERMNVPSQNRGGDGCSTSSSMEASSFGPGEEKSLSRSALSWHDVYSIAVKWRQISEPCDPVVWVNQLSDEFNAGFGSHTPITLGQAKVVRYYPNYQKTLHVAKEVIKERSYVYKKEDRIIYLNEDKVQEILQSNSRADIYKIVGEDFWLSTWCDSTASQGKKLEGTRITLLKGGKHGHDFSIRTPCTPARWNEFSTEMAMAWEDVCNSYCGETYGSTEFDALENVRDAILRMTYYWYNFMPLSRGTAVVGFTVLLGLLLAAGMEFTGSIPQGVQVDWEAILNGDPNSFVDSVKSWLYPSLKVTMSWKDYPDVWSTFPTTASVVAALSTYED
ncbi:hypothetical protein MLD38_029007 [Melastoma candidum]|uniref:Uncharacterized protein n=1 Tax=Melastoma candidum TaxID=119954 RepID=A0ACB9N3K2_9MYRT|nr:hypothetical protein MLD38_029007 [Melastoma candidum]